MRDDVRYHAIDLYQVVQSLYEDEVCPAMGVIRRRVAENYGVDLSCSEIENRLASQLWVKLAGTSKNRIATILDRTTTFVDPQLTHDPYPARIWEQLEEALVELGQLGLVGLLDLRLLAGYLLLEGDDL